MYVYCRLFADKGKLVKTGDPAERLESPFSLLLKHIQGVRVGPKSRLDIPISFAPEDMYKYEAVCTITVCKEDRSPWQHVPASGLAG